MAFENLIPMKERIVYDLGANTGDDIPYYLLKSDMVVAVEANPALCKLINDKFKTEIQAGRLIVENCVVTDVAVSDVVDFYISKMNHVLSQLPQPAAGNLMNFDKVVLPAKTISELIKSYGHPFYVKIDIEYYDAQILRALFSLGIYPPFISAESHSIEVFALLVAQGGYNAFKMVDGGSVPKVYSNRLITSEHEGKQVKLSFPFHSAGPFGNDVDGPWMSADNFLQVLALEGLGWKDIHATNLESADPSRQISDYELFLCYARRVIKARLKRIGTRLQKRLTLAWQPGHAGDSTKCQ
jgi:FkbM family methyltransferase